MLVLIVAILTSAATSGAVSAFVTRRTFKRAFELGQRKMLEALPASAYDALLTSDAEQLALGPIKRNVGDCAGCGHHRSFHSSGKYTCMKPSCSCRHYFAK